MDADRNRKLDFYEFSALMREREIGIQSSGDLRKRFDAIDTDKSGTRTAGRWSASSVSGTSMATAA